MRRRAVVALAILAGLYLLPDRRRRGGVRSGQLRLPLAPDAAAATGGAPAAPLTPAPAPGRLPSPREAAAVLRAAVRRGLAGNVTDIGAALAYYAFLAIPATLLVAVGVFGIVAGPGAVQDIVGRLDDVAPDEALELLEDTLTRVTENAGGGAGLAVVGLALAAWTASGAMTALIRGLNRVHGAREDRGFVRLRLTALACLGWVLLAGLLSFGLLVLGPVLSGAVGSAVGAETAVRWIWWTAQWPVLVGGLLVAVAGVLRVGPAGPPRRRTRGVTGGSVVAVVIWLVASAAFAVYTSRFGDYGAAWGSLSAVIVMLTWLWLGSLAILLGAEVDAELDRRAEVGSPSEHGPMRARNAAAA